VEWITLGVTCNAGDDSCTTQNDKKQKPQHVPQAQDYPNAANMSTKIQKQCPSSTQKTMSIVGQGEKAAFEERATTEDRLAKHSKHVLESLDGFP
jgi:hypothetical protein